MIDPRTYGDSKAAISLSEILNEIGDNKLTKRVGHFYCGYCRGVFEIGYIEDPAVRAELFRMWRNKYKDNVLKANMPKGVESRLLSIMKAKMAVEKELIAGIDDEH